MSQQANEADVEVRAVAALIKYLEPLSEEARIRVLDWARARFVQPPLSNVDVEPFRKMVAGVAEISQQLDPPMSPADFLAAASEIARARKATEEAA